MNRKVFIAAISAALLAAPLFAGALLLEATAKDAGVTAHITACHSPEKTVVTATAEGLVDGKRESIPLKVTNLATPGTYEVTRQWPREGVWAIRLVATNPEYKNYATGIVVSRTGSKQFFHRPTEEEVSSVLKQATLE
jgi:hypothetical protein